ncbi:hypothetical protein CRP19_000040 [Riemerella phage vB_RanS_CRP19]|nr:hypothetical protein CRP19_000040 [Riemerella phage vB_RanS_CRP19]
MKLQSMIDFVLSQQYEPIKGKIFKKRCTNYAEFLGMPLKLSMLIPCDENENPLKNPEPIDFKIEANTECSGRKYLYNDDDKVIGYYNGKLYEEKLFEFLISKSKILFEGFSLEGNKVCYSDFYFGSIKDLENKKVEDILYEIPEAEIPYLTSTAIYLIHKQ